ncbi:FHA domain protein [Plasticicumulans lactativorans]|uniref:FHA domain protein n=1 Tax=Plasticicumulans lactativorans TaxID=1133106 RepID=A0A4R2L640_9GAMM|nr:type VI secretion system-associated FHA domain protein TagH [Plasticicumulans lactativorans]TCO78108.1 FHA domain protein [Plasticicumulans lactativorans]
MPLTLTITSYQKLTPGVEAVRTLAEGTLSIGRAVGNDWVLPDPELVISGRHCLIQAHGGDYYVTDTSTNGVFIGGRRLGRGNSQQLRQGDALTLGDYELRVDLAAAAAAPAPAHDLFADLGKPAAGADPFAGLGTPTPAADPFAGLGTPTPAADPFAGLGTPSADPLAGLAPGGADPFADLLGPLHEPVRSDPLAALGPAGSDDVLGIGKPAGAAADFGLFDVPRKPAPGPATPADHLPSEQQAFVPPSPVIPDDWDDLLGPVATPAPTPSEPTPTPTPATEPEPAAPAPVADLGAQPEAVAERAEEAFAALPEIELPSTPFSDVTPTPIPAVAEARTPTPTPVPPAVAPAAPHVAPAPPVGSGSGSGSGGGAAAVEAFLAGAGLSHLQLGGEQQEALMHALGLSYRLMVQGLIDVLRARASLKGEFRLSQTTIRPIENNPLKFAPNVEEAMALLLIHRGNVYLPPERAIGEAFQDLKVHQMAMMAGMQAALALLLKRFDPAALEARLGDSGGGIGGLLGGGRKARNWEQFTQLYQEIAREAEDDFQDLFGREFARAYEEQIARLGRR